MQRTNSAGTVRLFAVAPIDSGSVCQANTALGHAGAYPPSGGFVPPISRQPLEAIPLATHDARVSALARMAEGAFKTLPEQPL